jgi:hypothetical protein
MPKVEIDYTNTTFYKIYCKNSTITDIYIGHTTNFVQRKHSHKQSCLNNKCLIHTCKLYKVIRDHGGWDNWNMEIIALHACEDHYSARKQEQHYFEEYKATLNSIEPFPKPKIIIKREKKEKVIRRCDTCNISFLTEKQQEDHNKTTKHINRSKMMETISKEMEIKNPIKNPTKYSCNKCEYNTDNKKDYKKHLMTRKHSMETFGNKNSPIIPNTFICAICSKNFNTKSGIWKHKKKCNYIEEKEKIEPEVIELENAVVEKAMMEEIDKDALIMKLLKQNTEVIELLKEQSKTAQEQSKTAQELSKTAQDQSKTMQEMIPNIGNNNTTNNTMNNNNFNLNVFLNETCKDAMNIKDFIESLRVQCSEMKEIQNIGFIELASKVLLKELSGMDVSKRPIHCSDLKRETLYIKDNNVWEKESESKPTMLTMMKQMQKVSYTTLDNWISKHPGCQRYDHPQHNLFMNTWGDICILDQVKDVKKISKRIAKEVLIDKENNK